MQNDQHSPSPATDLAPSPRNIRLTVEYDGTRYVGWQRQQNGLSIQQAVERALEQLLEQPVRVTAAGRTDAGVHALGQVVNFTCRSQLPTHAIEGALLPFLPADIAVHSAAEVPPTFHARRSARLRWYKFFLSNRRFRPAVGANYLTHIPAMLDVGRMQLAAQALSGEHDFRAFRAVSCTATRTLLNMHPITVVRTEDGIIQIDYRCRSFLQNMVRILTGTLVSAGRGKISVSEIEEMLSTGTRRNEAVTLPPHGLFLYRVFYEDIESAPTTEGPGSQSSRLQK